ncbi:MAG: Regulatory protein RecX [candidate division WS2 bacterium]|nr:Regulatory protein RecX [Candidatus Lithacetigena glycinireducens]MBT9174364.1 Regulatory protein RecX [Candidatus Lithacetigena glycinireducens]
MPITYEEGMKYALRLISFKDYPKKLLLRKLMGKGFEPTLAERVTSELVEKGYLDEKKQIVRVWEKLKANCNSGRKAFLYNLKREEYDIESIKLAESLYSEEEEASLANDVFKKICRKLTKSNIDQAKQKQRIYSFLMRKGFSQETIRGLIKEYEKDKGDI